MILEDLPPTISVPKAGEVLGLSRTSAYRAAAAGLIPTLRFGHRMIVPTARLLEMLGIPATAEKPPARTPVRA